MKTAANNFSFKLHFVHCSCIIYFSLYCYGYFKSVAIRFALNVLVQVKDNNCDTLRCLFKSI